MEREKGPQETPKKRGDSLYIFKNSLTSNTPSTQNPKSAPTSTYVHSVETHAADSAPLREFFSAASACGRLEVGVAQLERHVPPAGGGRARPVTQRASCAIELEGGAQLTIR